MDCSMYEGMHLSNLALAIWSLLFSPPVGWCSLAISLRTKIRITEFDCNCNKQIITELRRSAVKLNNYRVPKTGKLEPGLVREPRRRTPQYSRSLREEQEQRSSIWSLCALTTSNLQGSRQKKINSRCKGCYWSGIALILPLLCSIAIEACCQSYYHEDKR